MLLQPIQCSDYYLCLKKLPKPSGQVWHKCNYFLYNIYLYFCVELFNIRGGSFVCYHWLKWFQWNYYTLSNEIRIIQNSLFYIKREKKQTKQFSLFPQSEDSFSILCWIEKCMYIEMINRENWPKIRIKCILSEFINFGYEDLGACVSIFLFSPSSHSTKRNVTRVT
jgi:hypothetical protein